MASDIEKNLIEKLKSDNSSEVHNALLKVRNFYVRNQSKMKKLQKYSIIETIIPFLEHPKFCSTSLSIIADGCLELNFVHEVIKYNGIQSLMRIMKSLVNDDVQNRACRALGNLAQFDVGFKAIHPLKPVSGIINFLIETTNSNCQQTAVRTLMILGRNPKARKLIVRENCVIHIAKLLHSSNANLLFCSIKAVANLTRNCSTFCARQIIELHLHEVILKLSSHSEKLIRNHALISLKNLSVLEEVRSDLVKVGAVKLFTEILSELDSHEMSRLAALALCSYLDHIHMWSHYGTDQAVGLKALLVVLQNKKFQDIHLHIILSLIPLSYEFKIADILLNLDVLQILIEILNIFIEKYKCKLKNSSLKSKSLRFPPSANGIVHPLSSDYNLVGINISSHMSNNLQLLPKSNFKNENLVDNFQSENDTNKSTHVTEGLDIEMKDKYLESGDQLMDNTNIHTDNAIKISDFDTSYFSDEIQSLNSQQSNEISVKHTIDHYVLLFIFQLSFHLEKEPNSQVADKICFSALIDYLCYIHNPNHSPKAETILLNLIKNRYCFEKLVVSGFISEMEDKMLSSNYSCIHQSDVKQTYFNLINNGRQEVESDFGIGTLYHILATSEKMSQLHAICSISKLITNKSALCKLLFQANGFPLLCNFLTDNCITTRRKAVISLCEVYQCLTKEVKEEKCCFLGTCRMKTSENCFYKISDHDVSFTVSTEMTILANREKLCKNSEYFSALLDGHFLESSVKTISLPEISAESLITIFHFLHGCGSSYYCPYIKNISFAVLLELLHYCDRYLLYKIKANVEDRLCHHLLPSTVSKIYRESKINNSPALSKQSVTFALKIDTVQRDILWSCFEKLINLKSDLGFLDDIESLLKSMFEKSLECSI